MIVFKNGPTPSSFSFIFGPFNQSIQILQQFFCEKTSIQYMVMGFELKTVKFS